MRKSAAAAIAVALSFTVASPSPAAAVDASAPIPLSGTVAGELHEWEITPDAARVVFLAELEVADRTELYSVPVNGGEPIRLNATLAGGEDVWTYEVASDGTRVVYTVTGPLGADVFSVPVDGGPAIKLNTAAAADSSYIYKVTSDGESVVFVPTTNDHNRDAIYRVPLAGGTPQLLDVPLGPNGFVFALWAPPGIDRILYSTGDLSRDFPCCDAVWSTPLDGGPATQLIDIGPGQIEFVDDTALIHAYSEIYAVPIGGGTATRISKPFELHVGHVEDFKVSPDGATVVYRWTVIENNRQARYNLFSVPITGGPSTRIDGVPGANWEADKYQITGDSASVVYLMRNIDSGQTRGNLYRVPIGGGEPHLFHGYLTGDFGVSEFALSPDGMRLAYSGYVDDDFYRDLYLTDTNGGSDFHVDHGNAGVGAAIFTPDGEDVLYAADRHYRVSSGGGESSVLVDYAQNRVISGDGRWMVFESSADDLFSVLVNPGDHTCGGFVATHVGTGGDDVIVGTSGDDVIVGYGGDDVIKAKGGNDLICGGDGNDTLRGREGEDTIYGGDGRDLIYGGDDRDYLYGDAHSDTIYGEAGKDYVYGGGGSDWIDGGPQIDRLKGQAGNDTLLGGYGRDIIKGGFGDDDLRGQAGDDTLYAGDGTDTCHGGTGTDTADNCETTTAVP